MPNEAAYSVSPQTKAFKLTKSFWARVEEVLESKLRLAMMNVCLFNECAVVLFSEHLKEITPTAIGCNKPTVLF